MRPSYYSFGCYKKHTIWFNLGFSLTKPFVFTRDQMVKVGLFFIYRSPFYIHRLILQCKHSQFGWLCKGCVFVCIALGYATFLSGWFGQADWVWPFRSGLFLSRDISVWLFRSRDILVATFLYIKNLLYPNDYLGKRKITLASVIHSGDSDGWPGWVMVSRLTVGSWIMFVVFFKWNLSLI